MANGDLEALEIKIAFQDEAIERLSDTVYAQARDLARLAEQYRRLEARLQALAESGDEPGGDETPPHY